MSERKNINNTRYYKILRLDKNASPQDIRESYKRLIVKYHPDKGNNPKIFKEIQNAYEVLSDPKKKKIYDGYGEEGLTSAEIGEDFDPYIFFDCHYPGTKPKMKCKKILVELSITLEDAYNGSRKEVEYDRIIKCPKCKGTGLFHPNECTDEGNIIKEQCEECEGKKVQNIKRKIEIDLDKGVPDQHRYIMANEGNEYPNYENGDLIIEILLQKHKDFIRKGADLFYKCKISLLEALTGVKMIINHLNGRKFLIQSRPDEIIQPESLKTVKELGMPFFNSPNKFGNLYVEFKIVFPEKLTKEQNKILSEILKDERFNLADDLSKDMENLILEDYNESEMNPYYKGGKKEDWKGKEDDKDKGVNCANQ